VKAAPAVMQYYFKANSIFTMQKHTLFLCFFLFLFLFFVAANISRWLLSAANAKAKVERNAR